MAPSSMPSLARRWRGGCPAGRGGAPTGGLAQPRCATSPSSPSTCWPVAPPAPMLALAAGPDAPAQFVFDRGPDRRSPRLRLRRPVRRGAWIDAGREATVAQVHAVPRRVRRSALLSRRRWCAAVHGGKARHLPLHAGLTPTICAIAPGLVAGGDHVDGPTRPRSEGEEWRCGDGRRAGLKALPDRPPTFRHAKFSSDPARIGLMTELRSQSPRSRSRAGLRPAGVLASFPGSGVAEGDRGSAPGLHPSTAHRIPTT